MTNTMDMRKPGFRSGETWCRCGSRCEIVTHEGEDHELCPKCDAVMIDAIERGDIPQMQLLDDAAEGTPPRRMLSSAQTRMMLGVAAMGLLGSGLLLDADAGDDFDAEEEDEPEPDEEPGELEAQRKREQSEQREYHARLLYQHMVAAVLHVDLETGPRAVPTLPRQVDFEHLAALAFAATDDFDVVAKRERDAELG